VLCGKFIVARFPMEAIACGMFVLDADYPTITLIESQNRTKRLDSYLLALVLCGHSAPFQS
jgi:hypothetical protein